MSKPTRPPVSFVTQLIVGFLVPTIILMNFSDESRLGPLLAMVLALMPPVLLEIYSFFSGRKASVLSLIAIVGVLLIGVISLFGLSEEWLGVRRAAVYVIGAAVIAGVLFFKKDWIDKGLGKMIDMPAVRKAAKTKDTEDLLVKHIAKVGYILAVFLLIIAVWSYILTIIVINAPTGSSDFNAQYAQLRLLGLPLVSLPLLIGMVGLLVYLATGFEKLTGIDIETLLSKKKNTK